MAAGGSGLVLTTAHWLTIVLSLVGILTNVAWYLFVRMLRGTDQINTALHGPDGAVARLHKRIDELGEVYYPRKEAEMQFDALDKMLAQWREDSERRHTESLERLKDMKETSQRENARLLQHVDAIARRAPPAQ